MGRFREAAVLWTGCSALSDQNSCSYSIWSSCSSSVLEDLLQHFSWERNCAEIYWWCETGNRLCCLGKTRNNACMHGRKTLHFKPFFHLSWYPGFSVVAFGSSGCSGSAAKMRSTNEMFDWFSNYNYQFAVARFFSWFQHGLQYKSPAGPRANQKRHSANKPLYALHTSPRSTFCITAINWCLFKKEYAIKIAETIVKTSLEVEGILRVIDVFHASSL